eukprot:g22817.t1
MLRPRELVRAVISCLSAPSELTRERLRSIVPGLPMSHRSELLHALVKKKPELVPRLLEICDAETVETGSPQLLTIPGRGRTEAAIAACGRVSQWQVAAELIEMPRRRARFPCMNLYKFLPAMWRDALKFFNAMPRATVLPNVVTFSTLMSIFEKSWQWPLALQLFDLMGQISPNAITFTSAISAMGRPSRHDHAQLPRWPWALHLWSEMPRLQVRPNVFSFTALLGAMEGSLQWRWAGQLFDMQD